VSCDMARRGTEAMCFFQKESEFVPIARKACDLCKFVFVLVSGTVVAPIEAYELQRFEIS